MTQRTLLLLFTLLVAMTIFAVIEVTRDSTATIAAAWVQAVLAAAAIIAAGLLSISARISDDEDRAQSDLQRATSLMQLVLPEMEERNKLFKTYLFRLAEVRKGNDLLSNFADQFGDYLKSTPHFKKNEHRLYRLGPTAIDFQRFLNSLSEARKGITSLSSAVKETENESRPDVTEWIKKCRETMEDCDTAVVAGRRWLNERLKRR